MWNKTPISQLLGIDYPIVQGPFGGRFSSTKLVTTVSNLGGLGSFGLNAYGPKEILEIDREIKHLTDRPYVLNLWVPLEDDPADRFQEEDFENIQLTFKPYFDRLGVPLPDFKRPKAQNFESQVEAILEAKPPVASFIFGIPSKEIIDALKARKIILMAVATTLEEAKAINSAGIDIIIASGKQAGGHRASFLKSTSGFLESTSSLLRKVSREVNTPVIAAGGISTGRDIVAMLQNGAAAVQIGTAFLATEESNASDLHKSKLLSSTPFETSLTKVFTGRLARMISTDFIRELHLIEDNKIAPYPIQSSFLSPLRKAAKERQLMEFEAFYSGQPSRPLQHRDAKSLFQSLLREIDIALSEQQSL